MWKKKAVLQAEALKLQQEAINKRRDLEELMRKLNEQEMMLKREYDSKTENNIMRLTEGKDPVTYDMILRATNFQNLSNQEVGWTLDIFSEETRDWFIGEVRKMHKEEELLRAAAENGNKNVQFGTFHVNQEEEDDEDFVLSDSGPVEKARSSTRNSRSASMDQSQNFSIVGVMGYYDKGKSWLLNKLMDTSFPSSKRLATDGISFCMTKGPSSTKWLILDTAGFGSPVSCKSYPISFQSQFKSSLQSFLLLLLFPPPPKTPSSINSSHLYKNSC